MLVIFSVLALAINKACGSSNTSAADLFRIPVPEIVAFKSGGLRVSIPANPGISEFKFSGIVNQEIEDSRPGTINMETSEQTNGKLVLENRRVVLHRHDNISYWIYIKKDRLGYIKQPAVYRVRELVPYYIESSLITTSPPPQTEESFNLYPTRPQVDQSTSTYNNLTQLLDSMKSQIETLTQTVAILNQIVQETLPDAKKLTMSGRIPSDGDASETAKFILWEKLDLKPNIISATRNKDGSITFQVETLQEKIEVLKAAHARLANSKIVVS